MKLSKLRKIYLDICLGATEAKFQGRTIFFKHLGDFEQVSLDEKREEFERRISKLGTLNREDKLKDCIKSGIWSDKKEKGFQSCANSYSNFYKKKNQKFKTVKQIDGFFEALFEMRDDYSKQVNERSKILGNCAEDMAAFDCYSKEIEMACFSDKELTIPFFEDFDYLSDADMATLHILYYDSVSFLYSDNAKLIKQITCSDFFASKFWLADNGGAFLGKPIWLLTNLQSLLLSYGRRYSEVLKHCGGAPEHFFEEPEKLECYAIMAQTQGADDEETSGNMHNQIRKARGE